MTRKEFFSRAELTAILGQPYKESISTSQREKTPDGVWRVMHFETDEPKVGALKVLKWRCKPGPTNTTSLEDKWAAMRKSGVPDEALMAKAKDALNNLANNCAAASWIREAENDTWVLIRVCSKHKRIGLEATQLSPMEKTPDN